METSQNLACQVTALNDLIRINNDRITGYKKHMHAMLDDDLDELIGRLVYQSRMNIEDLVRGIKYLGGSLNENDSLSGKFYHALADFKTAPYRQNRQTMLDYCEYCEDVTRSAYQKVLGDKEFLKGNGKVIRVLEKHLDNLKTSYQLTKAMRDDSASAA